MSTEQPRRTIAETVELFGPSRVANELGCSVSEATRMGKHTLDPSMAKLAAACRAWGLHFDLHRTVNGPCHCKHCRPAVVQAEATGTEG